MSDITVTCGECGSVFSGGNDSAAALATIFDTHPCFRRDRITIEERDVPDEGMYPRIRDIEGEHAADYYRRASGMQGKKKK